MAKRRLLFESLETRQTLSADYSQLNWLSSELGGQPSAPLVPSLVADEFALATAPLSTSASARWDWLAGTRWYVPNDNLLAFLSTSQLTDQIPVADQTLWHITQSSGGEIAGIGEVTLSLTSSNEFPFTGFVTPEGQVRMKFAYDPGEAPATGVGQMRYINGAWAVEMQLASGSSELLMHWAYMTQEAPGVVPPQAEEQNIVPNPSAAQWKWLEGSHWILHDPELLGGAPNGVFEIDHFESGYFWGSGTSSEPFNVMGSVTPEGNLVLSASYNGGAAQTRAGFISSAAMHFHAYDSDSTTGSAWLIGGPAPTSRWLMSSVQGTLNSP